MGGFKIACYSIFYNFIPEIVKYQWINPMPCCVFTDFSALVIRADNLDARSSLSEDVDVTMRRADPDACCRRIGLTRDS